MGEGFDELKQTGDYARYLDLVHKKDRENVSNIWAVSAIRK